jgi:formyltetrahydrofolate synthetase
MSDTIEDKIAKLKEATETAKADLEHCERALKDSKERLDVAKELLLALDDADQERMQISETQYPALLALHQVAKDNFETAKKRYETNLKYLDKFTT